MSCSKVSPEGCDSEEICRYATLSTSTGGLNGHKWSTAASTGPYVKEAEKRRLTCGVRATPSAIALNASKRVCPGNGGFGDSCTAKYTNGNGDKWIGRRVKNSFFGVATLLSLRNDKWKGDVQIGQRDHINNKWSGQNLYVWRGGNARFDFDVPQGTYNSNSTVNAVFPALRSMFNALPKRQRLSIQRSMAKKGLYTSTIDGAWGRNTLIGLGRFSAEYLNTINLKSESNIRLVFDGLSDQSAFLKTRMASLSVLEDVAKKDAGAIKSASNSSIMRTAYSKEPLLRRKQIQFALRKLGFYSSSIDGLWGSGTSSAIIDYAQANGVGGNSPNSVFNSLISRVNVPSSFDAPEPKRVPRSSNAYGLKSITASPSIAADQAYAVCLPLAQQAKRQASNQSKQALRPTPYKSTCRRNYSGSYDCSSQRTSGGFWGGVADGVASSSAGRSAYNAVLDSCLAQYGWGN